MNEWMNECTFSGICFSYHGQAIHRCTHQLHVIQADFPIVTWQHVIHAYTIRKRGEKILTQVKETEGYLKHLYVLPLDSTAWPSTGWPPGDNQPAGEKAKRGVCAIFVGKLERKQQIRLQQMAITPELLVYLEVSSVQSSRQMFPHFHQFRPWAPGTGALLEWVLLQVCLKFTLPQQQLTKVICTQTHTHVASLFHFKCMNSLPDRSLVQKVILFISKPAVCTWDWMVILHSNMTLEHFLKCIRFVFKREAWV